MTAWVLVGIGVLILGFALRLNPLLVVMAAALATGLGARMDLVAILSAFGKAFNTNRYITLIYIVLPVIGILERHGLQERARNLIGRLKGATVGRLLIGYLLFRQLTSALGLTSIAGHAQTVRPLIAPMAEAAADTQAPDRDPDDQSVPAMAAATDNIGLFFGEDIFIAIGSILLMKGTLEAYGIHLDPLQLSLCAIPTAIAALVIHSVRLWLFDRKLGRSE